MAPMTYMSSKEPNHYIVNMMTLQKLNATWYERPIITSIEAIKGCEEWSLQKKDALGNFFVA